MKFFSKNFFFSLFCLFCLCFQVNATIIIVHGFYSVKGKWFKPGGYFFEGVRKGAGDADIIPFLWNGGPTGLSRLEAAKKLIDVIWKKRDKSITLIGHSHGGNVINLAGLLIQMAQEDISSSNIRSEIDSISEQMLYLSSRESLYTELYYYLGNAYKALLNGAFLLGHPIKAFKKHVRCIDKRVRRIVPAGRNKKGSKRLYNVRLREAVKSVRQKIMSNSKEKHKKMPLIKYAYLLGTPADEIAYRPAVKFIKTTVLIRSSGDNIQNFISPYGDRYAARSGVLNLDLSIANSKKKQDENYGPDHSELVSNEIGIAISKISKLIDSCFGEKVPLDASVVVFKDGSSPSISS